MSADKDLLPPITTTPDIKLNKDPITVIGDHVCVYDSITVDYTDTETTVFTLDPISYAKYPISDWEGYMYFKEQSGNPIVVNIYTEIDGVEVGPESTLNIAANGQDGFVMVKSLKHVVKAYTTTAGASGSVTISWRVCYYTK